MNNATGASTADAYDTMEALLCEMQGLRDELVETKKERDDARKIIAATLSILPCGHIPSHTPESMPERIRELVESWVTAERERDEAMESSNERGVVVSQVSGALIDAGMAVGAASGFGELVGQLAKERDEALLQLEASQSTKTKEV